MQTIFRSERKAVTVQVSNALAEYGIETKLAKGRDSGQYVVVVDMREVTYARRVISTLSLVRN